MPEAGNRQEEFFSEERLQKSLQDRPGASSRETIEAIKAQINDFALAATQTDDITMLMLRFLGMG